VDPSAVIIGEVDIAAGASVWPLSVIRGDIHHIRIGANSNIQDGAVLHVTHASDYNPAGHPLEIGEQVTVGHQVCLHGCRIEGPALVGMGSTVLDGALIEADVLLGAGSLVTPGKRLEGGYLWMGSPVQRIRPLTEDERRYLRYSAQSYCRLAAQYRAEQTP
jgi:carbonic anhydrase/acetyltransferase-like protein (isoleucine patch superfamily)